MAIIENIVLFDLQKAYDTVDHAILLKKQKGAGVDELSIYWFRSYLTGRVEVTDVDGTMWLKVSLAECHKVLYLGLCYYYFLNDMSAAVKCKLLLYADDSVLLASGRE